MIDWHWKNIRVTVFDTKVHYYTVLAKTTDHLLQYLSMKKNEDQPLFLFEKLTSYIDELETHLSLTIELAEWSTRSFTIKKYLVDADEELIDLYNQLMVVFTYEAFEKLPERIEIVNLMKGRVYTYSPSISDVSKGIEYFKYMKNQLLVPDGYIKAKSLAECEQCPFTEHCNTGPDNFEDNSFREFFH